MHGSQHFINFPIQAFPLKMSDVCHFQHMHNIVSGVRIYPHPTPTPQSEFYRCPPWKTDWNLTLWPKKRVNTYAYLGNAVARKGLCALAINCIRCSIMNSLNFKILCTKWSHRTLNRLRSRCPSMFYYCPPTPNLCTLCSTVGHFPDNCNIWFCH